MNTDSLKMEIPSKCVYLKLVESAYWRYIRINKLEDRIDSDYIILALVEGVVNSIKHGNKSDLKKKVSVSLTLEKNIFKIIIEDMGNGFNLDSVVDPTLEENLPKRSGRGIFIMQNIMDKVRYEFYENRTILTMEKHCWVRS